MLTEGDGGKIRVKSRHGFSHVLSCASVSLLSVACARANSEVQPAAVPVAQGSGPATSPAPRVVSRALEPPNEPSSRKWPECTRPAGAPKLETWPLIGFPQASKHEVPGEQAQFNVRATLSAVERADPCAESSAYWWPAQKCTGDSFVTLSLAGATPAPTLKALAVLSFWGGSLDVGREYEFSLGFCRGTSGAPVAHVFGFEALGRAAGGDPHECQAKNHDNWPYRPIASLRVNDVLPGGFRTSGFVTQCFEPVPCRPGIKCKPQAPPSFMLATNLELGSPTLRLDEACGKRFKHGKYYDVAVVLESTNTMGLTNLGYPCPSLAPR